MPRRKKDSSTVFPKEDAFAKGYASGLTAVEAARQAGYEAPDREGTRLLNRRAVADRILAYQRPYVVTWKRLLLKAQKILDQHLDDRDGYAKELLDHLRGGGQIEAREYKAFVKMLTVSASDRNTAVRLVTEAMSKINPKSLTDAAGAEDAAMDRDEAIRKMLGEDAEPGSDEISVDPPTDPDEPGADELDPQPADNDFPPEITH